MGVGVCFWDGSVWFVFTDGLETSFFIMKPGRQPENQRTEQHEESTVQCIYCTGVESTCTHQRETALT